MKTVKITMVCVDLELTNNKERPEINEKFIATLKPISIIGDSVLIMGINELFFEVGKKYNLNITKPD